MKLTADAQKSYEFTEELFRQKLIGTKEFLKAVKVIYQDDVVKQTSFLIEQGFSKHGAVKNIYNLDKGSEVL